MKGIVSPAHTYAAALEQPGACKFWSLTSLHSYIAYGADTTNVFSEAPPTDGTTLCYNRPTVQGMVEEQRMTLYPSEIRTPSATCTTGAPREPTTLGQDDRQDTQVQ